ncbi:Polymyxin resistance protein ArnT, undecaprenyl phosphate-alpha-L-Ara4N transferase [Myxococcus hansupus]|uniref:Polymyxin resistance protein ArnT, undecaprenyl phosphate-alpha-L-Ara4N transferase n=1 Tax=Pseudomyxococcus hansupus TaxID=1297742 RepID=A0A0H4WM04_9BACT|nr:glycosyltransferase family 39 protein [Myxococcus hansupus]AKQ64426.1 Polymyxin resistance protein ArnT, undecaprenyl phosphate-alpha-L-Ara4N transferase [Myxococcus hansupus]
MESEVEQQQEQTFTEAILGKDFFEAKWAKRWLELSFSLRVVTATAGFAALLFLPYLGAVGLWDCWETHYGEVARMMIVRQDYVYPFWEGSWFFSKPPLTMWMQALGMNAAGAVNPDGVLGRYMEWGMRMPFAILSIAAVALLSLAVARVVSKRAGLATGFVLATMPLYFLLTRQTVTDTPFVTTFICAMACALIGQLDATTKHRAAWWYGFYFFAGLASLAKGILGVGLPAVILALYAALSVIPWDSASLDAHLRWLTQSSFRKDVREGRQPMPVLWGQMFKMHLGTGILVFFAVAGPWYLTLSLFGSVDDEGKLFWYRFFVHDHLNRLTAGVHTTTPGGTFIYFIEQGGFAIFPWVALLPGAFSVVARMKLRSEKAADHLAIIAVLWVAFSFWLLSSSATKFHHYVFPVLPGVAVLLALFIDRLWEEGISAHAVSLIFGLLLFVLVGKNIAENPKIFTDLFVYNYDRPYPQDLVTKPIAFFASRPLWTGDLVTLVLLGFGVYLSFDAFSAKGRARTTPSARAVALLLLLGGVATLGAVSAQAQVSAKALVGVAVVIVAAYLGWESLRANAASRASLQTLAGVLAVVGVLLAVRGFRQPAAEDSLLKALSEPVNIKKSLGFTFAVAGGMAVVASLMRARAMLFGTFWVLAAGMALWFNWSHWVDLSHHWTQRDLFWRYYAQRQPGEPIIAYMMNWRGETLYSQNTVEQYRASDANARMRATAMRPGRTWALVEHNRLNLLRTAVGSDKVVTPVDRDINNKFLLVTID